MAPSTRCGGSSRPGSSPGWPGTWATSVPGRTWPTTPSPPRSSSGPRSGVPDNPGAWLMAVGKRRAVDLLRRRTVLERKHEELGREALSFVGPIPEVVDAAAHADDDFGDDLLRLIFVACHPVLSTDARVALTLRLLGGPHHRRDRPRLPGPGGHRGPAHRAGQAHAGRGQGPVRGSRGAAPHRPPGFGARGASTSCSTRGTRPPPATTGCAPPCARTRCASGRVLAELLPDEPEVHGLVALMEIQASRARARVGPVGSAHPAVSTRTGPRWDHILIRRGLAALDRADGARPGVRPLLPCRPPSPPVTPGPPRRRRRTGLRIAALYDALAQLTPSPVVELNRAVAYSMAFGPGVALELVDALRGRAGPAQLPPPAQRAGRPAREARALRRSARRVRTGGGAHPQQPRS